MSQPSAMLQPGPDREAVHHGDGRLGEIEEAKDEAVERLHARPALGGRVPLRRHGLHVAAGREVPAGAGQDDHAHRGVALDLVERVQQLLAHP